MNWHNLCATREKIKLSVRGENTYSDNNKIWILFAMSAYSFDELKFTSTREKWKEKENNKQNHQKIYNIISVMSSGLSGLEM